MSVPCGGCGHPHDSVDDPCRELVDFAGDTHPCGCRLWTARTPTRDQPARADRAA